MIPWRNLERFFYKTVKQPAYAAQVFIKREQAYFSYFFAKGKSCSPEAITLFLTHRCNLRCKMCGQWGEGGVTKKQGGEILKQELSLADLKKLVDGLARYKPSITLFGGEPLLFAGAAELISYIKTKGMHCLMITNGSLLENFAEGLVNAGLERDGSVVSGAAKVGIYIYDDTGTPVAYNTVCDPDFYNDDSNSDGEKDRCNPKPTLFSTSIDRSGYFYLTFPAPTGLQSGRVYAALVDITNLGGAHFKTPTSFSITESKLLESTESAVKEMQNVTLPAFQTGIQNAITTGINDQKQMITDIMVGTGGNPATIMNSGGMVGLLQQSMTSFETKTDVVIKDLKSGAETTKLAGQELQATSKKFSWKAGLAPDPALQGDTVTLQVQGLPALLPLLSIYSWDNKPIVSDIMMTETRPGFYIYEFQADSRFAAGKAYTYMVTEQVTSGLVSGSGIVESMSITTVAGLAAAAPEAERAAKKALDAIKAVESVLVSDDNINISMSLKNLQESINALPATLEKDGPNAKMMSSINDISERLNKIMGEEGLDFSALLDEKLGDSSTMKTLRNKTDTISSIVDLLLQIMESKLGGVDSPILSSSLQSGSVKFRIMAINPSKTKVQKIQVKKYLPEEVKPKDVMDLGGLELEYDSEKAIYYVYKNDLELRPSQVSVFEVEVEDIWMIPDAQIAELKKQTDDVLALFEKTDSFAKAKEVADSIYPVLEEMPKAQADDSVSREQHIGIYRQNILNIKSIRDKLAELTKMLAPEQGKPTPDILERGKLKINMPAKSTTWLIILVVIIFLGLFAGIFFFVWQGQIRSSQDLIKGAAKSSFPDKKPEEKNTPPPVK